ncbi:MAG: VCBS repeat-containing protein [Myxococcales bacterium]|nr:VCBS repeat-containing protein [Myxococcales bacterium]
MSQTYGIAGLALATLLSLPLGACSQTCGDGAYPETRQCSIDGQTTVVTADRSRIDLTAPTETLTLFVDVRRTRTKHVLTLAEAPRVDLEQDGEMAAAVQVELQSDRQRVAVRRSPEQLRLGAVDATVTIGDLAPVSLSVQRKDEQRLVPHVYRRPRFDQNSSATLPLGVVGPRAGSIRGRAAVQVAGPFGETGQLLVTASADTVVGVVRWLELFSAQPGSQLDYNSSGVWKTEQLKQQEGPTALLAMGKGAILIYDQDMAAGRGDLSLIPLLGTRLSRLSAVATQVPRKATALAACAEESLVFLAEPNQVQAFAFDLAPAARSLRHLQSLPVADSEPIVATRDLGGAVPMRRSQRYAVALATHQGDVQLVPVAGDAPMNYVIGTGGLDTVRLGIGISALALADLDSDGLQDLVFATSSGSLYWLPQQPDRGFAVAAENGSPTITPLPLGLQVTNAASLSVGDLNGDTWPDLAVATADGAGANGNAQVFFNNRP